MIAYFNGRYLPKDEIYISPNDRGFLFADGLYEVIRVYRGKTFQMDAHLKRLERGAEILKLDIVDFNFLTDVSNELVKRNDLNVDATVYIQITRGAADARTHFFPAQKTDLTVYATALPFNIDPAQYEEGISVVLTPDIRWAHCDIKTVGLTPNVLACQKARENDAGEAVFVKDGVILEGTHSNFIAVMDGTVVTYPKCNYILPGITRELVLKICHDLSIPVEQKPVYLSEIHLVQEMMMTGTTMEITPVIKMDGQPVGDGRPGPVTRKLQNAFNEIVRAL